MSRQRSIAAALAVLLIAAAAFAADPPKSPAPPEPTKVSVSADKGAGYVHTVIFHLKKDAVADTVVADCHAMLESIPSVRHLKAGRPAPEDQSTPKLASRDYDVALVVLFDDAAGLKTYLEHEQHLKFVAAHEKDFESVQVFDFIDAPKK